MEFSRCRVPLPRYLRYLLFKFVVGKTSFCRFVIRIKGGLFGSRKHESTKTEGHRRRGSAACGTGNEVSGYLGGSAWHIVYIYSHLSQGYFVGHGGIFLPRATSCGDGGSGGD
jgi:hypothetical protein